MFRPGLATLRLQTLRLHRSISLKPDFSRLKLIEQPVGNIVGTVNDATPIKEPDYFHGSYHWTYERLVAISLIPLTVTPFVASVDFPVFDALLSTMVLLHSHIGFQSCIIDYIPKRVYGVWHSAAMWVLTLGSAVGVYGIYKIETEDEGVTNLIQKLWTEPEPKPFMFGRRY